MYMTWQPPGMGLRPLYTEAARVLLFAVIAYLAWLQGSTAWGWIVELVARRTFEGSSPESEANSVRSLVGHGRGSEGSSPESSEANRITTLSGNAVDPP